MLAGGFGEVPVIAPLKTDPPELAVLLVDGLSKQKLAFQEKESRPPAELGSEGGTNPNRDRTAYVFRHP
jgi:hypothetical protein